MSFLGKLTLHFDLFFFITRCASKMLRAIKGMFSKEDSAQAKNPLLKVVPCKVTILTSKYEKCFFLNTINFALRVKCVMVQMAR